MEMGGGTGKGGGRVVVPGGDGVGKIDPANLHLMKELTQIRKAARALRDPGTTSSWRSPLNSSRSFQKHQYLRRHKNGEVEGNAATTADSSEPFLQIHSNTINQTSSNSNHGVDKGSVRVKGRENRVFLYNWKSQISESEKSRQIVDDEIDSLSDGRNGSGHDSRSDSCLSLGYSSAILRCKDKDITQSIRHAVKKKSKRGDYSTAGSRKNIENLQKHSYAKDVEGLRRGNSKSLVDHSDDTEDYSNSEDFRREYALSPLIARLKKKALPGSTGQLLRSLRKDDDSVSHSTPAMSTSSYNRNGVRNPSAAGSWDAATTSVNDADDEVEDQMDLPGRRGCGISCWSRRSTPKSRGGYGSCCSPSLSDTLRRKGTSIFCGRHYLHRRGYSLGSNKMRIHSRTASQYRLPLLNSRRGDSSMGSGNSDDDLSTNIEEIDLEGLSRLDGRRWSSSCRSQEGLNMVASNQEMGTESSPENDRSLSHKYKPMFFEQLIGQDVVVQSLRSAISIRRIAPISLFQGPRGTGKTSMARIFAAALNCLTTEGSKPCGSCRECSEFLSGKARYLTEVNGSNKKGINNIKKLLKSLPAVYPSVSRFMVFVIDECHLLPSKTWLTFLQLLKKPLQHVVFILVTTDVDNMPRAVLSRCQKHIFNKITSGDIVTRLIKIVADEKLDVESDALELIASNADGSLRDAETMLDQLSLFGKRITISLVNELIGVVSDEKLLDLLELSMSSNATETVLRARELLDSGVDPMVLMSQLATLIVDIIAGTYPNVDEKHDSFIGGRSLSEKELDRLRHALSLLSEAEKHLRVSNERSTWFTATLLQLGSMPSPDRSHSGSSRRQSSKATGEDLSNTLIREADLQKQRMDTQLRTEESSSRKSFSRSSQRDSTSKDNTVSRTDAVTSDSNPSQIQFSSDEVITESRGDGNSRKTSLRCVNSKILTDIWLQCIEKCHSKTLRQLLVSQGQLMSVSEAKGSFVAHIAFGDGYVKTRAEGFLSSITNAFEIVLQRNVEVKIILLPDSLGQKQMGLENQLAHLNTGNGEAPAKRINSNNHEQRLETAWLQAMEKGTPGSTYHSKPERNQVLPQDNACAPLNELQQCEDELNHNVNAQILTNGTIPSEDELAKGIEHHHISPSLLHESSLANNFSKDNVGYESGTAAPGCLCWNNRRISRRRQAKGKQLRARKHGGFSWLGSCVKPSRRDITRHKR